MDLVLNIENLHVAYTTQDGNIEAIRDVSLSLRKGEVLGIVGESGSGKSTLALFITGLLPKNAQVKFKEVTIMGNTANNYAQLRSILNNLRGTGIFMIPQDPFSSLNPLMKIKEQMAEAYITKLKRTKGIKLNINEIEDKELTEYLKRVNIPDPQITLYKYPHQLSGGQIQRIMIAMALILEPRILIADEPTTALDVITQIQILNELRKLINELETSIIFITHDIALASIISDRVAVMYGGFFMETGNTLEILKEPLHPYTKGLIASIPNKRKHEGPLSEIQGIYIPSKYEGCPFWPRCPHTTDTCKAQTPILRKINNRLVRCFLYE
ncbi:ABC transporter ATP-binding protein [Vulcanisaeta thermophila]|uniref:ABC transporter ATP-binding protein n=1 Tax=Vulcanisaeta thermophila TaxID=867917 RepID=UPI0008531F79|nr:ABC transporter ATP-binding protein [Vulcanisaeta thermophila]